MSTQKTIRRVARHLRQRLTRSQSAEFSWTKLIGHQNEIWSQAKDQAEGPRVLVATSMGGFILGSLVESVLSTALTLRGAQVDVLLCDSFLPMCQLTEAKTFPVEQMPESLPSDFTEPQQPRCKSCEASGRRIYEDLGLPIHWYSDYVNEEQRVQATQLAATLSLEDIGDYRYRDLAVGEHALAGALRYFARGTLDDVTGSEIVLRRYLQSSLLTVFAMEGLLSEHHYDVACFHHGIYVPQGLIGEVCRQHGVRVVNWNPAYRKQCFIFSHHETYHHTMIEEPIDAWKDLVWTSSLEQATMDYLKSRWQGTQDWIWFHEKPVEDIECIAEEIGIDFSKPCIGLLTNVMWDAQLHYSSNAFENMLTWVLETIAYFAKRPDLQLLIRVHPAEVRGAIPSQQPLVPEIEKAFTVLPPNVFVIGPESQVSTYAAMERCGTVIIYNTKTGIEISSMGIPVIVAGEAWIRGKGFSQDASTRDEYFRILDRLPLSGGLTETELETARKYAFHFFFRRMIPLPFIHSESGSYQLHLKNLDELQPGRCQGLDVICQGILNGDPFIYPAEKASDNVSH